MYKDASLCYVFDYILPVRPSVWAKVGLWQLWLCMAIGRRRWSPVFNLEVFNQYLTDKYSTRIKPKSIQPVFNLNKVASLKATLV